MPYYDFECKVCTKIIEINEPTPPPCTSCGNMMIRVWSPIPTHFKTGGFYSTGG
jgi:predicted nucleic acid-binding Zn ribbon protein